MRLRLLIVLAVLVVLSGLLEIERRPVPVRHHAPSEGIADCPDTLRTSVQVTI